MKVRPVGAELFHADGQTDMTKLTVDFRNSAKAPKDRILFKYNPKISLAVYGPTAEILTFRHRASSIWDSRFATLQRTLFI